MDTISSPLEVVRAAYAAFGAGNIPAILDLVSEDIDWTFRGAKGLPYTGNFRGRNAVEKWFASVAQADEIQAFEPREFLVGGENVTVLGWERTRALPDGNVFDTDWVHVFTIRGGRVARFWGIYDTQAAAAARS
ncbi:MAG TPA: nuclear transport factor 2 family protein [Ramlibacter sp.]|uniref:nuclear transport factor 2 family protein n=1 Tax=Ramlibacter sp. TaxID=1917967 RepID=UPI002ED5DC2F